MPAKPLQLPAHDPKVKKIILESVSILNDHFDKHPSLKATPRYEQIFNSRRRAAPPPSTVPQPLPSFTPHGPHFWPSAYRMPIPTTNAPRFPHHAQFAYQPTPPLHFPSSSSSTAHFQPQIDPTLHGS